MENIIGEFGSYVLEFYNTLINALPFWSHSLIGLFSLIILVIIYSIIVWHGYRFLSKRDLLGLNLSQYNRYQSPFFEKFFHGILYFVEYLIISPFIIFGAFAIFTLMLIFLNEGLSVGGILLVSATVIAAIRATSYYKEDLSRDLAKMFPFLVLAVSLLNPQFFRIERIFLAFQEIPVLVNNIGIYLIFIICFEIVLRFFQFIFSLFGLEEVEEQ
jgi:hypothetical protein